MIRQSLFKLQRTSPLKLRPLRSQLTSSNMSATNKRRQRKRVPGSYHRQSRCSTACAPSEGAVMSPGERHGP